MKHNGIKFIALFTALALLVAALPALSLAEAAPVRSEIWDGSTASSLSGSGTESDPYLITDGSELAYLAAQIELGSRFENSFFRLENDIYLNDISNYDAWDYIFPQLTPWTPIGSVSFDEDEAGDEIINTSRSFLGNFNGGGHTVYGMFIDGVGDRPFDSGFGLFGCSGGIIENLNVDCAYASTNDSLGALVGFMCGGAITSCTSGGQIYGVWETGGIVGSANDGLIMDCVNSAKVSGAGGSAGGIVGDASCTTIASCSNRGHVGAAFQAGGIVGSATECEIERCSNIALVDGSCVIGGIAGDLYLSELRFSYNASDVCTVFEPDYAEEEGFTVGGLCGYAEGDGEIISDCYNAGAVSGSFNVGGLCGVLDGNAQIVRCYSAELTTGQLDADALIGAIAPEASAGTENCLYLASEYGAQSEFGAAATSEELMSESAYTGFDFDEVWFFAEYSEYPYAQLVFNPYFNENEPSDALPGDVNGDGEVSIADAVLALRLTMGLIDAEELESGSIAVANADYNGDSLINIDDAVLIARAALELR